MQYLEGIDQAAQPPGRGVELGTERACVDVGQAAGRCLDGGAGALNAAEGLFHGGNAAVVAVKGVHRDGAHAARVLGETRNLADQFGGLVESVRQFLAGIFIAGRCHGRTDDVFLQPVTLRIGKAAGVALDDHAFARTVALDPGYLHKYVVFVRRAADCRRRRRRSLEDKGVALGELGAAFRSQRNLGSIGGEEPPHLHHGADGIGHVVVFAVNRYVLGVRNLEFTLHGVGDRFTQADGVGRLAADREADLDYLVLLQQGVDLLFHGCAFVQGRQNHAD